MPPIVVAALYRFVRLDNYQQIRQPLLDLMLTHQVRGTLLLAPEGINGTLAGSRESIDTLIAWLRQDDRFADIDCTFSYNEDMPFYRSRVKLKKEIVTMGVEGIDPNQSVGTLVKPADWNALISDPEVTVIDTRNGYESAIGSFKNAVLPNTQSFREFPEYANAHLDSNRGRKVAMFCTGGIRCEKSTAYLKALGFSEVFHLQGGILKYLEEVPKSDSLWEGECFVFDNRVSVNYDLHKGSYDQCHACRLPVTEADKQDHRYQQGVSCPSCYDKRSEAENTRFREREKQVLLARQRGERHIGNDARLYANRRKQNKLSLKEAQRRKASSNSASVNR